MEIANINNIVVQFDLPLALRLLDSIQLENLPEGYEQYIYPVEDLPVMARFHKRVRQQRGISIAAYDKFGKWTYSEVQIWLDDKFLTAHSDIRDKEKLIMSSINFSVKAINVFLNFYREATNEYWINNVFIELLSQFLVVFKGDGDSQEVHTRGGLGTGEFLGSVLKEDEDGLLRFKLNSQITHDPILKIFHLAHLLYDSNDFATSLTTSNMAFEAHIKRLFYQAYLNKGYTADDYDKVLQPNENFTRDANRLLKKALKDLINQDIENPECEVYEQYTEWKEETKKFRDDIQHGSLFDISKKQALATAEAVHNLITSLNELLSKNGIFSLDSQN